MPSYYVLRGEELWNIYRCGHLAFTLSPKFAKALLDELSKYGCQIAFGD